MTAPSTLQRSARPIRRDAATRHFVVGQIVWLKDGFRRSSSKFTDIYLITGTMPPRENMQQYRIRNDDERYERVTTEDNLEPVRMSSAGDGPTL
jgi:hypothetical protein